MIHPGLAALKSWGPIEYAAGFRARLAAIPVPESAHHSWQCGWEDADTEALELARHKCVLPSTWEPQKIHFVGYRRRRSVSVLFAGNVQECLPSCAFGHGCAATFRLREHSRSLCGSRVKVPQRHRCRAGWLRDQC
jgi:hypothetical protein